MEAMPDARCLSYLASPIYLRDVPLNKVPDVLIAVGCIRAAMHH